ncbi:immunoglobulin lambda-1 light chain-like isoform X1 [Amblyraja radiata]|uniref:immunoglobulin lambda-1 light chain-like isoform X1 n=1 Tax=Amblyraja radiata TaxID=386614 RepID=UPI001402BC35|nr:immunoglobulin lambda-1 light chain-like isoform X1 [Amblyraja radiata]
MQTLCFIWSLALWLSSGESQTVTQPAAVSVNPGVTATLDCNVGIKDIGYSYWYKQIPGTTPQWILRYHYSDAAPTYGSGFSSDRFTSKANSAATVYQLIISKVEVNDAAVYYCMKWFTASSTYVFGPGTKLFVTASQLPDPSVKLLGPSDEEMSAKGAGTLVCLVSKLSAGFPAVSWTVDGSPPSGEVQTSAMRRDTDNTFSLSSYLTVLGADWSSGKLYSCTVQQGAASKISATLTQSSC